MDDIPWIYFIIGVFSFLWAYQTCLFERIWALWPSMEMFTLFRTMNRPHNNPTQARKRRAKDIAGSRAKPVVVVTLGDSITHEWVSASWVGPLGKIPDLSSTCDVVNAGVNSDMAYNALIRVEPEVVPLKPQIVIVLIGTNDIMGSMSDAKCDSVYVKQSKLPSTWRQEEGRRPCVDSYKIHLTEIVNLLLTKTNAKVAVVSPPPLGENFGKGAISTEGGKGAKALNVRVKEFVAVCKLVVEESNRNRTGSNPPRVQYIPLNETLHEYRESLWSTSDTERPCNIDADRRLEFSCDPGKEYNNLVKIMIGNALSHYWSGTSYEQKGRDVGLRLTHDTIHLAEPCADILRDLVAEFVRSCVQTKE